MARRASLRAADADREQVAEALRQATAEGRLLPDELEARLEAAFAARSYGELDALVADLPRPPARRQRQVSMAWMLATAAFAMLVVVPLVVVVLAAVLFVVLPVAATLAFWLAVCWWSFGHHHRARCYRGVRGRAYPGRHRAYITRF